MAIKRIWHGWTSLKNADKYQDLLINVVIPGIEAKKISGYQGIEVLRTEHPDEVEFVTMMTYDSLEDIKGLQGADYKKCYLPDIAQTVLKRWDAEATHLEIIANRTY